MYRLKGFLYKLLNLIPRVSITRLRLIMEGLTRPTKVGQASGKKIGEATQKRYNKDCGHRVSLIRAEVPNKEELQ